MIFYKLRADFISSIGFLTRIPVEWLADRRLRYNFARSIWLWPMVGALVGVISALALALCVRAGLSALLAGLAAALAQVLITGALHEDGLADTADGLGGGKDISKRLRIMRDSNIGSYGAVSLIFVLMIKVGAISELASNTWSATCALIISCALSRMALAPVVVCFSPARKDGAASTLRSLPLTSAVVALCAGGGVCLLCVPPLYTMGLFVTAIATALVIGWSAQRSLGGYTGDILGSIVIITECALLVLMTLLAPA